MGIVIDQLVHAKVNIFLLLKFMTFADLLYLDAWFLGFKSLSFMDCKNIVCCFDSCIRSSLFSSDDCIWPFGFNSHLTMTFLFGIMQLLLKNLDSYAQLMIVILKLFICWSQWTSTIVVLCILILWHFFDIIVSFSNLILQLFDNIGKLSNLLIFHIDGAIVFIDQFFYLMLIYILSLTHLFSNSIFNLIFSWCIIHLPLI